MITPIIRIYQTPVAMVIQNSSEHIKNMPNVSIGSIDSDEIQKIANNIIINELGDYTNSPLKQEIIDLINLLGASCEENSIKKIKQTIDIIHSKLNNKSPSLVKSWVNYISNLHPKIDEYIKSSKPYWKTPYSEIIGTNTIMYYADETGIDILYWAKRPTMRNNQIIWSTEQQVAPSYIRESIREKLPTKVAEYIQNANHVTTKYLLRNLIYDARLTTADNTGTEVSQTRPIPYNEAHGAALNNDWYHQAYRILGGQHDKYFSKQDAMYNMDKTGYFVHVLVNHITPLLPSKQANSKIIELSKPLGVEETFPRSDDAQKIFVLQDGQSINSVSKTINDNSLKTEEITERLE